MSNLIEKPLTETDLVSVSADGYERRKILERIAKKADYLPEADFRYRVRVNRRTLDLLLADIARFKDNSTDRSEKIHAGKLAKELEAEYTGELRYSKWRYDYRVNELLSDARVKDYDTENFDYEVGETSIYNNTPAIFWSDGSKDEIRPTLRFENGQLISGYRDDFANCEGDTWDEFIVKKIAFHKEELVQWNEHRAKKREYARQILTENGISWEVE